MESKWTHLNKPLCDCICLFHFSRQPFSVSCHVPVHMFMGHQTVLSELPEPGVLYSALDFFFEHMDESPLMRLSTIMFSCSYSVKWVMERKESVYYFPPGVQAAYHDFRKFYDNFFRNFNIQNYSFK